jgi:hypothetical protein
VHASDANFARHRIFLLDPFTESQHQYNAIAKRQVGEALGIAEEEWQGIFLLDREAIGLVTGGAVQHCIGQLGTNN